jgi:hypothetical protein
MNRLQRIYFRGNIPRKLSLMAVCAGVMLAMGGVVSAQSGCAGTYCINSYSIDGGAGTITTAPYTLRGTVGQMESGVSTGSGYAVAGGVARLPASAVIVPALPAAAPIRNYFVISNPTLSWNRLTYATGYRVELARNATFTPILQFDDTLSSTTLTWTPPIALANGTYYWRVKAKTGPTTYGPYSLVQSFVVNAP